MAVRRVYQVVIDADFVLRLLAEGAVLVQWADGAMLSPAGGGPPSLFVPDSVINELVEGKRLVLQNGIYRLRRGSSAE